MTASVDLGSGAEMRPANETFGYKRAQRAEARRAFLLAVPLLVFLSLTFILPIVSLLWRSVDNPEMRAAMPSLVTAIADWDARDLPPPQVFDAFAQDMSAASKGGELAQVGRRLNYYEPGFRSLLLKTVRNLPAAPEGDWRTTIIKIDQRWGETETWRLVQRASRSITPDYLLAAIDRKTDANGEIVPVAPDQRVYVAALLRTLWISTVVTVLCLVLGYPVAYLLANQPTHQANVMMIFVIVPFWTSLLVRTTAWYVLLQPNGVINTLLLSMGLASEPVPLVFNRTGVLIGLTHILLPFMILANYAVMKGISPVYYRAALSLGAHPVEAFRRVYVPQTLPGIGAGVFLVFVLALGYYITPALLGGGGDEMISQLIAIQMEKQLNWGLAGALSAYLVVITIAIYVAFSQLMGVDRLKMG
jgi:putative spermidine/putrescine transport system permease protein